MVKYFYTSSVLDFITLDTFFQNIKNADYTITDEQINDAICKKIGKNTLMEISDYFDDEEEKIIFFTWSDSGGYVALTTIHIIIADKASGGNVSNITSFYYDEIKNLQIYQEKSDVGMSSSHSGILDFVMDIAITSAMDSAMDYLSKDVCDLKIQANGRFITLPGLMKIEADRIAVLYNKYKKAIRTERKNLINNHSQAQVVVQKEEKTDVLEQIKKLSELKDMGILSEEEFSQKKTELLGKL